MSNNRILYKPQSKILALIICSFNKAKGGVQQYNELESLVSKLAKTRIYLVKARQDVFNLLRIRIEWEGILIRDHEFNKELQLGKDFGGSGTNGRYLPAIDRYEGRFFTALDEKGKEKLLRSKHHVLIESGLYGLVLPTEPIQLYTLDIKDEPEVQKIWKENRVLTKILVEYIQTNGIERIFDLTARDDYRELIDWDFVNGWTGAQVLHCFSRIGAGPNALRPFGQFMNNYLLDASEEELLAIKPEDEKDGVIIRNVPYTLETLPTEDWKRRWRAATIGQDDSSSPEQIDVIVDASNVARDNVPLGQMARFDNILKAIDYYEKKNLRVRIIADANLLYKIDKDGAYGEALARNTIRQSPSGRAADEYILKLAYSHPNSKIVSNDNFHDWREIAVLKADWDLLEQVLNRPERFVKFKINGEFYEFDSS